MATRPLDFSTPHVLRNPREYRAAIAEIDDLLDRDPAPRTEAYDLLEILSVLVEAYENAHEPPIPRSSPRAVVAFVLEQRGMKRADLLPVFGTRSRLSEFLAGKRRLSNRADQASRGRARYPERSADRLATRVRSSAGSCRGRV